jgi:hypothetical protein
VDLDVCTKHCTIEPQPQELLFLLGVPGGALSIGCMYAAVQWLRYIKEDSVRLLLYSLFGNQ